MEIDGDSWFPIGINGDGHQRRRWLILFVGPVSSGRDTDTQTPMVSLACTDIINEFSSEPKAAQCRRRGAMTYAGNAILPGVRPEAHSASLRRQPMVFTVTAFPTNAPTCLVVTPNSL